MARPVCYYSTTTDPIRERGWHRGAHVHGRAQGGGGALPVPAVRVRRVQHLAQPELLSGQAALHQALRRQILLGQHQVSKPRCLLTRVTLLLRIPCVCACVCACVCLLCVLNGGRLCRILVGQHQAGRAGPLAQV